jgi:hypothetical protein
VVAARTVASADGENVQHLFVGVGGMGNLPGIPAINDGYRNNGPYAFSGIAGIYVSITHQCRR